VTGFGAAAQPNAGQARSPQGGLDYLFSTSPPMSFRGERPVLASSLIVASPL
jgi:hypothetical protein